MSKQDILPTILRWRSVATQHFAICNSWFDILRFTMAGSDHPAVVIEVQRQRGFLFFIEKIH